MRVFFDSSAFVITIHIGSALALNAGIFVSADARQCAVAEQAGLTIVQV